MKTIKQLLTIIAVLLCSVVAKAYDFKVDGIYYNIISAGDFTAEVTSGDNKYTGDVIIPSTVTYKSKVLTVTSIGDYAFENCSELTSVVIGNSVTSIKYYAFRGCSGLTSVEIGNNVTSIGIGVFNGCTSLKDLRIEDGEGTLSLEYNSSRKGLFYDCPLETLYLGRDLSYSTSYNYGHSPFYDNKRTLTSVTIGNSVTSIGSYAFEGCSGLTSIEIPNSVTSIGIGAFSGCTSLKDLRIEDGEGTLSLEYNGSSMGVFYNCPLETLYLGRDLSYSTSASDGYSPFYNKTTLTSVTIGNNVTSIGEMAFKWCSGLTSIEIPNSVTSIESGAFSGCSGLTSVEIPNSVTSIRNSAFYNCSGLTSIEIPNSVTSIGDYAFNGCSGLTSIVIGNSVTSIGYQAFYGCSGFESIYLLGVTPPYVEDKNFTETQCVDIVLYVPQGSLETYQAADTWKNFWNIQEIDVPETENPEVGVQKCAIPVISFNDNGLDITCDTQGANFVTAVKCCDANTYNGNRIDFSATYEITTYATKAGCENSESVTAVLCWIKKGDDSSDIIEVVSTPVLIYANNGNVVIKGVEADTEIIVYDVNGIMLDKFVANGNDVVVNTSLEKGDIVIVNIAGKAVKVVMQ